MNSQITPTSKANKRNKSSRPSAGPYWMTETVDLRKEKIAPRHLPSLDLKRKTVHLNTNNVAQESTSPQLTSWRSIARQNRRFSCAPVLTSNDDENSNMVTNKCYSSIKRSEKETDKPVEFNSHSADISIAHGDKYYSDRTLERINIAINQSAECRRLAAADSMLEMGDTDQCHLSFCDSSLSAKYGLISTAAASSKKSLNELENSITAISERVSECDSPVMQNTSFPIASLSEITDEGSDYKNTQISEINSLISKYDTHLPMNNSQIEEPTINTDTSKSCINNNNIVVDEPLTPPLTVELNCDEQNKITILSIDDEKISKSDIVNICMEPDEDRLALPVPQRLSNADSIGLSVTGNRTPSYNGNYQRNGHFYNNVKENKRRRQCCFACPWISMLLGLLLIGEIITFGVITSAFSSSITTTLSRPQLPLPINDSHQLINESRTIGAIVLSITVLVQVVAALCHIFVAYFTHRISSRFNKKCCQGRDGGYQNTPNSTVEYDYMQFGNSNARSSRNLNSTTKASKIHLFALFCFRVTQLIVMFVFFLMFLIWLSVSLFGIALIVICILVPQVLFACNFDQQPTVMLFRNLLLMQEMKDDGSSFLASSKTFQSLFMELCTMDSAINNGQKMSTEKCGSIEQLACDLSRECAASMPIILLCSLSLLVTLVFTMCCQSYNLSRKLGFSCTTSTVNSANIGSDQRNRDINSNRCLGGHCETAYPGDGHRRLTQDSDSKKPLIRDEHRQSSCTLLDQYNERATDCQSSCNPIQNEYGFSSNRPIKMEYCSPKSYGRDTDLTV